MAISLGAIVLTLSADTASLEKGLDRASHITITKTADMGKAFKWLGGAIAAAAIPAALFRITEKAIELADTMNKAAQSGGVTVEWLSGMKFAAELADVSFEEFTKGVQKLSRSLLNAGEEKGATNALKQLGIAAKDSSGHLRSTEDVLPEIAEHFKNLPDGATKTALAMELFGKAGARLVPLLNQGKEGLAETRKEAERLGQVMSTETARAAEEFNDNLKRLQTGSSALGLTLANEVLPPLVGITNQLVASKTQAGFFTDAARLMKDLLVEVADTGIRVVSAFQQLGIYIKAAGALILGVDSSTDGFGAEVFRNADREILKLGKDTQLLRMSMDELTRDSGVKLAAPKTVDLAVDSVKKAAKESKGALDSMIESMIRQVQTFRMSDQGIRVWEIDHSQASKTAKLLAYDLNVITSRLKEMGAVATVPVAKNLETLRAEFGLLAGRPRTLGPAFDAEENKDLSAKAKLIGEDLANGIKAARAEWAQFHSDVKRLGADLSRAAVDAIFNWRGFGELMKSIEKDLLRLVLNKAITSLLGNIFFPGQGGLLGTIGGWLGLGGNVSENRPGRAWGGPVIAGLPYTVGELGPETFIPSVNGRIVPRGGMGGSTVVQNFNIDARGGQGGIDGALAVRLHDAAVQNSMMAIAERARRRP